MLCAQTDCDPAIHDRDPTHTIPWGQHSPFNGFTPFLKRNERVRPQLYILGKVLRKVG